MAKGNLKLNWALAILALAVGLGHVLYFFPRTVDDMYIYLRYAENIASGLGFVYNVGERVEGYSGPLWQVLLAFGHLIGLGGVTLTKVLGVLSLAVLCWGIFRLAQERFELSLVSTWLCVFGVLLNTYIVTWSILGLETTSYLAFMVWTAVWMHRRTQSRSRRTFVGLAVCAGALLLSRPEAPLFAGTLGIAEVLRGKTKSEIKAHLEALIPPSLVATLPFALLILLRRLYFGLWLPHTHYAKPGNGFDVNRLGPLVTHGASVIEVCFFVLFCISALWLIRKRNLLPAVILLSVMFFTLIVDKDWMPNVRHFLPWQCIIPMTILGAASTFRRRSWIALATVGVLVFCVDIATIDVRFVPSDAKTHNNGEGRRPKSWDKWKDTWRALNNLPPEHVMTMDVYHNGMITQVYDVIESDASSLSSKWYIGRDIGRVGWLTPINIYDTAALFTPEIIEFGGPSKINNALIKKALERNVVAIELLGDWYLKSNMAELRQRFKESDAPGRFSRLLNTPPTHEQIVRRYKDAIAKLPTTYGVMTLYGEGVGAAIKRRLRHVSNMHKLKESLILEQAPQLSSPSAKFDEQVELLGCDVPPEVKRGTMAVTDCYYRVHVRPSKDFTIFVHTEKQLVSADHVLPGGTLNFQNAPIGKVIHDQYRFYVSLDYPHDTISQRIGLYEGNYRATARPNGPESKVDEVNRVELPDIRISD